MTWTRYAFIGALAVAAAVAAQEDADEDLPAVDIEADILDIKLQLTELRAEVSRLQQTLDLYMGSLLPGLQEENRVLRRELGRLQGTNAPDEPTIPRPAGHYIEEILSREGTAPEAQAPLPGPPSGAPVTACEVIAEWGRTPEEALLIDPEVPSLKGAIWVTPAGASEAELVALARRLRSECDGYDNVNIEVFDDLDTARAFKETNVAQPESRVLSISKHAGSGRDTILLFKDGQARELE